VAKKKVVVIPGDDAAPEAVFASLDVMRALEADIEFNEFPTGDGWVRGETEQKVRAAIDSSDSTLFGSTSGKTGGIGYLRWGKQTYANVRPCRYMKGFKSPLKDPDGIDFIIVRENMEDLYLGVEGPLENLAPLHLQSRILRTELPTAERGIYAVKVITERNTRRIAHFAFKLAQRRKKEGHPGKVTVTSKYNMLRESDGFFRQIVEEVGRRVSGRQVRAVHCR
jgi:isocitrate/isopropylmalate dehydrogenase